MQRAALLAAIIMFSGCAANDPAQQVDCGDDATHPFENRCLTEAAAANEVCTMWLGEGAQRDESIYCQATTDGHATVHIDFGGSGQVTVYVRNEAGDVLVAHPATPGEQTIRVEDEPGRWRLVTDFSEATGPIRVQLWG